MIYTRLYTSIGSTVTQDHAETLVTLPARPDAPLTVFHTTYTEPVTFTYYREHWDGAAWLIPGEDPDNEYIPAAETPRALLDSLKESVIYPEFWNIEGPVEFPNHGGSRYWFTSHHPISKDTGSGGYVLYDAMVSRTDPIIAHGEVYYGEVGFVRPDGKDYWLIVDSRNHTRISPEQIPREFHELAKIYDDYKNGV